MTTIVKNIKAYFSSKQDGEQTKLVPEGMCPNCWGHDEWDGQYYTVVKDKHLLPDNDIYQSFISKIVDKHISTTHKHENKYICTTCDNAIV
jgi:hypothetical protein